MDFRHDSEEVLGANPRRMGAPALYSLLNCGIEISKVTLSNRKQPYLQQATKTIGHSGF